MTDWRFYSVVLHVSLLPVSRAGAVEVSLSPSSLSWYFGFLETYVFPFILAASIALLIGYGISRLFEGSREEVPEFEPDADAAIDEAPLPPMLEPQSEPLVTAAKADAGVPMAATATALLERIGARATEQAMAGGAAFDPEILEVELPPVQSAESLVQRIGARVTEQVMGTVAGGASVAGSVAGADSSTAGRLDALLQRIGARAADEPADAAGDGPPEVALDAVDDAAPDLGADTDRSPAERLDSLLQRIGAGSPDQTAEPVTGDAADKPPVPDSDETPSDRLDSLIQRIGARAAGQPVPDLDDHVAGPLSTSDEGLSPAEKLDALMKRIGSDMPEETPAGDDGAADAGVEAVAPPGFEGAGGEGDGGEGDWPIPLDFENTDEPVSAESLEHADSESLEVPDIDLPEFDPEFDTAFDESIDRRIEPTIGSPTGAPLDPVMAPLDVSEAVAPSGIEFEPAIEPMMDASAEIEPEVIGEAMMDAPVEIEPEVIGEPMMDAPIEIEPEVIGEPMMDASAEIEPEVLGEPMMDAPVEPEPEPALDASPPGSEQDLPDEPAMDMPVDAGWSDKLLLDMPVDRDLEPALDDGRKSDAALTPAPTGDALAEPEDAVRKALTARRMRDESRKSQLDDDDDDDDARPPSGAAVEPISTARIVSDRDAAARMAARIIGEFEDAVSILRRFMVIMDGYESARESLDSDVVSGMHLSGFDIPEDAESALHRLGGEISDAAIAGYGTIGQFNHIIGQLAQMARGAPLDEGWNELVQNRISETVLSIDEVCTRLRAVASGDPAPDPVVDNGPQGSAAHRDGQSDPPGWSVGGE